VFAKPFRLHNANVACSFLSAKITSEDKITGLRRGADDYMTKPFNLEEFSAPRASTD